MDKDYSVLMSVYYKENSIFFTAAIESMLNQTIKTNDFVIVCDGPLSEELDRVIDDYIHQYPGLFHIVRLKENLGLAQALNVGMAECKNELIARMDSDDIALPFRMERQLSKMESLGVDIVSGSVREFSGQMISVNEIENDEQCLGGLRKLPEKHEQIVRFARKRSPFNHPAVLYKKSVVEKCGGYVDYAFFEDYYLWVTMLQNGATGYNINDVILYMRAGENMYKRRGGIGYVKCIVSFKKHLKDIGFINTKEFLVGVCGHVVVGVMPNFIRRFLYAKVLRKEK